MIGRSNPIHLSTFRAGFSDPESFCEMHKTARENPPFFNGSRSCFCDRNPVILTHLFYKGMIQMQLMEERIRRDGIVRDGGVLKVDSFLNHQMDIAFFTEMAKEFKRLYQDCDINKILTIEASGIGVACIAAQYFGCPVVFAKKSKTINIAGDVWTSKVYSFTHSREYDIIVSKDFLTPADYVLIIDDFLANGAALQGLLKLCDQAGATVAGAGICIEKAFQPGGDLIRGMGVRVESLARIKSMSVENGIEFC